MIPSINEVIKNPELLNHDDCWSFYDWFCNTDSLERRAKAVIPKLKWLVKHGIINGDKNYVWLKNNCPMNGSLYDDIRISTLDDKEDFLGGFCPRSGRETDLKAYCWILNDYENFEFQNWTELKSEILKNEELRNKLIKQFN